MNRTRALMLGGLALLLFAVGSFIGAAFGSRQAATFPTIGLYEVEPRTGGAGMPDDLAPARFLLRADGELLLPTGNGGFAQVKLPLETKALIDDLLRDAPNWKDDYEAGGLAAQTRMQLRVDGDHPRTISIESPLYNKDLPDSLYRLLITMARPTGIDDVATPAIPAALVFHLLPLAPDASLTERSLPTGFDITAASSEAGLHVKPADLGSIATAIPELNQLTYPNDRVSVDVDGTRQMLVWTPDWSDWLAASAP